MYKKIIFNRIIIICVLLMINTSKVSAQNCLNYHANCDLTDNSYAVSSMSLGMKIVSGEKLIIMGLFYAGKANYISVCGESGIGKIQFKILDYETKKILYDNSEDNLAQRIAISIEVTAKVIIRISAPSAVYAGTETKCVGLLIAQKYLKYEP